MREIIIYDYYGKFQNKLDLNLDNLKKIHGMLTRCILNDKSCVEGFSDVYGSKNDGHYDGTVHDNIYLWTWDNLDEKKHELIGDDDSRFNQTFKKIEIDKIKKIESISHSNPRWGCALTNKFEFKSKKDDDIEFDIPDFLKNRI